MRILPVDAGWYFSGTENFLKKIIENITDISYNTVMEKIYAG